MVPLGPFNGKSFGTAVSPWVVVPDALRGARVAAPARMASSAEGEPAHLREAEGAMTGYDLECETKLTSEHTPRSMLDSLC